MEIDKLLAIGFIWEVAYLDWLANVVVVQNKGETWRVCEDYTNLNEFTQMIVSICLELIILLILRLGMECFLSYMLSSVTTKSPCFVLIKKKRPLSHPWAIILKRHAF